MNFTSAQLLSSLAQFPKPTRYWIAYSGGLDSTVLLHAMASCRETLPLDIAALHIDHGLQPESREWQQHCQQFCEQLHVPLTSLTVDVERDSGKGLEAAARAARYQAFASTLQSGEVICLAQHQDDQAETVMLQLLRGSGAAGLAAMPGYKVFADGHLMRPLLPFSRAALRDYAEQHELKWIEDPSNEHLGFDRNYLRHEVMPILKKRWPTTDRSLARSAAHLAEANSLLLEIATQDWQVAQDHSLSEISLAALKSLSEQRQRNLLRYWIHHVNHKPLPDSRRLQQLFSEVIDAVEDAEPCVSWHGIAVRRYRQRLYLTEDALSAGQARPWDLSAPLSLAELNCRLVTETSTGQGLDPELLGQSTMRIDFRHGGEVCRPCGRDGKHHELRKLFQEWGVPPWQRSRVPLLYVGEEIASVIGYCICEGYAASDGKNGIIIKIEDLYPHGIARQGENNDNIKD